jgi:hypothetical protein
LLEQHAEQHVQINVKEEAKPPATELSDIRIVQMEESTPNPKLDVKLSETSALPGSQTQDSVPAQSLDSKESLNKMLRVGKYVAANRELLQIEKAKGGSGLDDVTTERVHRIGDKFQEALRMLKSKPGDLKVSEQNKELGLHWGMKLEGSIMQIVSVKDYDVDFVKMIALDLQRDMENNICDDDVSQEILGAPMPHDICWRRRAVIKGVGQKLDDVMMVNSVNALDEDLGAVCSMKYTLAESATVDPHGIPIPAVASGFSRTPFVMYASSFTPLALGGDQLRGVRKVECLETKLSSTLAKVLGVMPNFLLKKLIRGNQETMAKLTLQVLKSAESENLVKVPHHADFLDQLRQEIIAKASK